MKFDKQQQIELDALIAIITECANAENEYDEAEVDAEVETEEQEDVSAQIYRLIAWLEDKGHTAEDVLDCLRAMAK